MWGIRVRLLFRQFLIIRHQVGNIKTWENVWMHTGSPGEHMANTWEHVSNSCCWSHNPLMVEECNLRIIHNPPHIICISESLLISHHCWDSTAPVILSVCVYSEACVRLDQPALPCCLCDYLHTCVCVCVPCAATACLVSRTLHSPSIWSGIDTWATVSCQPIKWVPVSDLSCPCHVTYLFPRTPGSLPSWLPMHTCVWGRDGSVREVCVYSCQLTDSVTWKSIGFYVVRWVNLG